MFQIGHHVIRRNDDCDEIGTVIGVIPDDHNSSEYTLYDVEFPSGLRTLHGYQLRYPISQCRERDELTRTFHKAVDVYHRIVGEMDNIAGMLVDVEFELVRNRAAAARNACKLAHECLQQHTVQHGC